MPYQFLVKGINPMGRIVEIVLVAESEEDAKTKATEAGLRFVTARSDGSGEEGEKSKS